jgi:amidophosphoribosyltransferase
MTNLIGNVGIGHVRYPTAGGGGGSCFSEAQPLYTNSPFGIALAHNGNLTNTMALTQELLCEHRHINTDSDSELLLNVFAGELQKIVGAAGLTHPSLRDVFAAVRSVMYRCTGAYSVILLINGMGLLAFRDPFGIRPLCFGARKNSRGVDYAVASESVAIDALDPTFKVVRDVRPGEAIFMSFKGEFDSMICHDAPSLNPCLFEYVYFARPDSIMDGVTVYESRLNMGDKLALRIMQEMPGHDIDVVIPIPDTSRTSALQCAYTLNKPYREGYVKNRYIARTFIMPGQEKRKKTVRLKLNTIKNEFNGLNVLLVDDSIVRGTTSMELVKMAREAGAAKVYFASAAPPVRYPNVYGIDIPSTEGIARHYCACVHRGAHMLMWWIRVELIANNRSYKQIAVAIGADAVFYNELDDLEDAVRSLNPAMLGVFYC